MSNRLILIVALVGGLLTGAILLTAVVALAPVPLHVAATPPLPTFSPSPSPSPSPPLPAAVGEPVAGPERRPELAAGFVRRTDRVAPADPDRVSDRDADGPAVCQPVDQPRSDLDLHAHGIAGRVSPGRDLADRVAAHPGRILVITDFDGTIAEIRSDPMAARIEPGAMRALRRLARVAEARPERLALAVLTGRAVADVLARVRVGGLLYLGNHGLEVGRLRRGGRVEQVVAEGSAGDPDGPAARLGISVAAALGRPDWLFVEVKGGSVAFHYRQAPVAEEAFRLVDEAVGEALAGRTELERFDGRLIIELRPAGAGGKGAAVARLVAELEPASVLALGDDRSDAEAFRVLASERAAGRLAALNVGVHDRRATPPELLEAADVMLASPRDAGRLLAELARIVEPARARWTPGDADPRA